MKSVVWGLVLLIAMVSASAAFLPQPGVTFEFKGAKCFNNGSMYFNVSHEGNSVAFKDVVFTADSDDLGLQKVKGIWYRGDYQVYNYDFPGSNYTGNDYTGKTRFRFLTTNNIFTGGKYIITLYWPSLSPYYDKINFAVVCPGITCKNNDRCISQQACTNQTCQWVNCAQDQIATGHVCLPKCNDYDSCTQDYFINGQCVYVKSENCAAKVQPSVKETNVLLRLWNWLKSKYE